MKNKFRFFKDCGENYFLTRSIDSVIFKNIKRSDLEEFSYCINESQKKSNLYNPHSVLREERIEKEIMKAII